MATLAIGVVMILVVAGATRWLGTVDVAGAPGSSAAARLASDLVRLVFILTCVAGAIWWVIAALGGFARTPGAATVRRSPLERLLSILIVVAILGLAWLVAHLFIRPEHAAPRSVPGGAPGTTTNHHTVAGGSATDWRLLLALVVVVGAVGALAMLWSRASSRRAPDLAAAGTGPAASAGAAPALFDAGGPDPMAEPDPRRAVLAAYQRLLTVLARHDLGRHRSEAPFEHLNRVLGRSPEVLAPARALTRTFEVARFSDHEITPATRDEVLASLRAAVGALEGRVP